MEMNPGELIDRYTVAKLYVEHEGADDAELRRFGIGITTMRTKSPSVPWDELIDVMYTINATIWDYEAPIHSGKMEGDPVIAGILALRVRKFNTIRVKLSKMVDKLVGMVDNR